MRPRSLFLLVGVMIAARFATAFAGSEFTPSDRVEPLPGGHFLCDVNFTRGGTEIGAAGSVELDHAVAAMNTDRDALVVLDAHTDAAGAAEFNSALAQRRAEAIKDGLVARGIDPDRIVIAIYGENTARGQISSADRRVDLWMTYTVSVQDIVDRTLAAGDAVVWSRPLTPTEVVHRPRLVATRPLPPVRKDGTPILTAAR